MTNQKFLLRTIAIFAGLVFPFYTRAALDTNQVEKLTGLRGAWSEAEGVFKVTATRSDLPVTVDGWKMPPFMGLTTWAGFIAGKTNEAMIAGDLVLFEDEVNPVMSALFEHGVNVTALHNHFFFDEPRVFFMHIGGEGKLSELASGVKAALAKQKEVRSANPKPTRVFDAAFMPEKNSITGSEIDRVLGSKGQAKDGMFKVVFGRKAKMPCGCDMTKEMGVNTWGAFAGTDDNAIVDGDFAVLEDELQPVLRSLRSSGVNIVAIHSHMTHENPRILFLHYWGKGKAIDLAGAIKSALATQNK